MAERLFGIDFSGAKRAGNAIWVAQGELDGSRVRIASCKPGSSLAGSGPERSRCLAAVVELIAGQPDAVFGCDFPFSLPAAMIEDATWRTFALALASRHATAESFLADCRRRGCGREIRRVCDRESRVPFAAYNLRIYRQTYHGICDVLAPLVRAGAAIVLPMEAARTGRPWVIETCPASTLKHAGLYRSYKGRSAAARDARRGVIDDLVRRGWLAPLRPSLRRLAVDNAGGDALDSMVAAMATGRALAAGAFMARGADERETIEGRVYY
jgi:hypothetical protein